ncbi:10772_t:CDS:2 [Funneliformis mosseae]|uniref:10772_t:CDS:1 n=1 Tax=Funneliformis mosseae TaxID=27381 RepID=A0A9N8ZTE0_FUNMO|nr:10772_t:CDS:2 [Funneliformis mosseae]
MSLFFVPLTSPLLDPIPINISETITINDQEKPKDNFTIGDLKIIIWGIIGDNSNSKDFFKLKLWKVDLEEGKGKWKELETLAKSSYTEAEIENFGGIKLLTTSKVVEVFDPTSQDFNEFLIRSIERMSQHILLESYGRGVNSRLYEAGWQNEWYRSAVSVVPIGTSISANVGYVFGSDGYLDYYVNGEICWGIELTREETGQLDEVNIIKIGVASCSRDTDV